MFRDYVVNDGRSWHGRGELGAALEATNWDPGYWRPYLDEHGRRWVSIIQNSYSGDKIVEVPVKHLMGKGIHLPVWNATSLRKEQWIQLDQKVVLAARRRLRAVEDLAAMNNFTIDGMGTMTLEYEAMSDPGSARQDMDTMTEGDTDSALFKLRSTPLPITHANFKYGMRRLAVSRKNGQGLDALSGEWAGRRVGELLEQVTIGTVSGVTYGTQSTGVTAHDGSSAVYGWTNHPARITKTDLTTPVGTNPEAIVQDILEMIETMQTNNFFGPYLLYHSTPYSIYLDSDYFRSGGTSPHQTVRERVMKIGGITDIRRLDYLTSGYQLVLINAVPETARMVTGMDITTVQWQIRGGMEECFKVMAIMAPQMMFDYNGVLAVQHATTS